MPILIPRQFDYYSGNCNNEVDGNCGYTPWYSYGRWIVLAAIIVGAFLLFLIFSCITARRRRRRGMTPFRGTGWASGPPPGHGQAQYTGYGGNQAVPPPIYSPPQNQEGYNYNQATGGNQGYFGGQQNGVELQQPNSAYVRGGEEVYPPPAGAPPGIKTTDGIIR